MYLAPPDAAAAFVRGAVDAWSIWDPFFAIAELKQKARALPLDPSVSAQNSFFLVNGDFAAKHPDIVATINGAVATATKWADDHRDQVAAILSEASGVDSRRKSGPSSGRSSRLGRSMATFSPSNRLSPTASKGSG